MLAMIAPDQPAHMAVTKVAITLQHIALTIVLLCVSVNLFSNKKAPFGAGLTIKYLGYRCNHSGNSANVSQLFHSVTHFLKIVIM